MRVQAEPFLLEQIKKLEAERDELAKLLRGTLPYVGRRHSHYIWSMNNVLAKEPCEQCDLMKSITDALAATERKS